MNSQEDHKRKKRKSAQKRKTGIGFSRILIVIVLIIIGGFFLFPYLSQYFYDKQTPVEPLQVQSTSPQEKIDAPSEKLLDEPLDTVIAEPDIKEKPIESPEKEKDDQELSRETVQVSCEKNTNSLLSFYSHLDRQPYIQETKLENMSGIYFTNLIQKLLNNPPVVTRETDDLYTILKNTAHFFRIIGKKNITIIKGILHNEKDQFENILKHYYEAVQLPDCTLKNLTLTIPDNSLYDYAGFFLNTMGGRLYLFRRDSHSRMVINYYSILIVDQANQSGKNRHGIKIKQPLDSLITEIENVGTHLKLRESYLDKLYDLKERYQ